VHTIFGHDLCEIKPLYPGPAHNSPWLHYEEHMSLFDADWTLTDADSLPFDLHPNGTLIIRWANITDGNYTIELISPDGNSIIQLMIKVDVPPTVYQITEPDPVTNVTVGIQIYQIPSNISGGSDGECSKTIYSIFLL